MAYFDHAPVRTVDGAARRMDLGSILLRRWLACWIDFVVVAVCLLTPFGVLNAMGYEKSGAAIGSIAFLAYFPITEGLWGRTLGKKIAGLVVVDAQGRPPGLLRATGRTVLRLVEVNPFLLGGIPAGLVVIMSKRRKRLGDMLAGTYVLRKSDLAEIGAKGPVNLSES